jgi:7,8-dihydro-6-hydroxymethylpterin-pyrophosphokinase
MLKRRTILAGLTVLAFTLAVSTKVYGQSATGPDAWQTVYNNAVAGATTTISVPLLQPLLSLVLDIFYGLAGFWGG